MRDAFLCFNDLLLRHALKGLLPVLMHMDLELVHEALGLDVRAILVEDILVPDKGLFAKCGVLMHFNWRKMMIDLSCNILSWKVINFVIDLLLSHRRNIYIVHAPLINL